MFVKLTRSPRVPHALFVPLRQTVLESLDNSLHLLLAVGHLVLLLHHGAALGLVDALHLAHLTRDLALLVLERLNLLFVFVHLLLQLGLFPGRVV